MAKGKHSTALFEVINRPTRVSSAPPQVVSRAPANIPSNTPQAAPPAPVNTGETVAIDRDRHRIAFNVSFTSVAVAGFAVLVIVGLAYLVGRGAHGGPAAVAASTEEIKKGPAHPAVLEVGQGSQQRTTGGTGSVPAANDQNAGKAALVARPQVAEPVTPNGPVAAPGTVKRTAGKNYCIMQSYPDEATAKEAQSVLLANGISCTVERGPSGWVPMSWYSVVGTQPFERVKSGEYDAYAKAVEQVKYGEKSKFKKFEPRAYRWK